MGARTYPISVLCQGKEILMDARDLAEAIRKYGPNGVVAQTLNVCDVDPELCVAWIKKDRRHKLLFEVVDTLRDLSLIAGLLSMCGIFLAIYFKAFSADSTTTDKLWELTLFCISAFLVYVVMRFAMVFDCALRPEEPPGIHSAVRRLERLCWSASMPLNELFFTEPGHKMCERLLKPIARDLHRAQVQFEASKLDVTLDFILLGESASKVRDLNRKFRETVKILEAAGFTVGSFEQYFPSKT